MAIGQADIHTMETSGAEPTIFPTFRSVKNLVLKPHLFYESLDGASQVQSALVFLTLAAFIHSGLAAMFEAENRLFWAGIFVLNKFLMPFVMTFAVYISSAVCCRGVFTYRGLFVVVAFAQVSLFASWIPGVEWKIAAGVWGLYLTVLGMNTLGGISKRRAAFCLTVAFFLLLAMIKCFQLVFKGL